MSADDNVQLLQVETTFDPVTWAQMGEDEREARARHEAATRLAHKLVEDAVFTIETIKPAAGEAGHIRIVHSIAVVRNTVETAFLAAIIAEHEVAAEARIWARIKAIFDEAGHLGAPGSFIAERVASEMYDFLREAERPRHPTLWRAMWMLRFQFGARDHNEYLFPDGRVRREQVWRHRVAQPTVSLSALAASTTASTHQLVEVHAIAWRRK